MSEETLMQPEKYDKLYPALFHIIPPKPDRTGVPMQLPSTFGMAQKLLSLFHLMNYY